MATIKEFHDSIRELLNIGQGQYYTPESIDIQLNTAIKDLYRQEYSHFEATQQITDTLGFYKKTTSPLVLAANIADLPSDFYHFTGIEADSVVEVEVLKDAYWFQRKHSKGFPPTSEYPIARQLGAFKLEVLPEDITNVTVSYLRKPATAKFGYDVNGDGTGFIYNESESTQIDWPEIDHPRIQSKVLGLLGISLRDPDLIRGESIQKSQNENA